MGDPINHYSGGGPKHISSQEIEEMKENMKRVPVIQLQSDVYHENEALSAENILDRLPNTETKPKTSTTVTNNKIGFWQKWIKKIQELFIPLK